MTVSRLLSDCGQLVFFADARKLFMFGPHAQGALSRQKRGNILI
jgi:hypothetical protein